MTAKTFSCLALAFVGVFGASMQACGPDKPPLTPDSVEMDAGAVPDLPSTTPGAAAPSGVGAKPAIPPG